MLTSFLGLLRGFGLPDVVDDGLVANEMLRELGNLDGDVNCAVVLFVVEELCF